MVPRGILHAASGVELPLLNIPGISRPAGPDAKKGFARELDREVDKIDQSQRRETLFRERFDEGERAKESRLGNKAKEPRAAWGSNRRESVGNKERVRTGPAETEQRAQRPETSDSDDSKESELTEPLLAVLEKLFLLFLDAMNQTRRVEYPGPGGSTGLNEGKLGPRFATLAPTAIYPLRGESGDELTPIAVKAEVPPEESGNISPNLKGSIRIEGVGLPVQEGAGEKPFPLTKDDVFPVVDLKAAIFGQNRFDVEHLPDKPAVVNSNITTPVIPEFMKGELNPKYARNKAASGLNRADGFIDLPVAIKEIEVVSSKSLADRLAELINKAGEAFRGVLRAEPATGTRNISAGDKAIIWATGLSAGKGAMEPEGSAVPLETIDSRFQVNVGRIVAGFGQGELWNINTGGGQFNRAESVEVTQAFKPGDPLLTAEIERLSRGFERDMVASVRLRLHPPDLGHLVVSFRRDENGLRIEFHTPHPEVLKTLQDAAPKMIERMEEAGVDIDSLDVFLSNDGADDRRTSSPLDDPLNPPTVGEVGEEGVDSGDGLEQGRMMYLADDASVIDLLA